MRWPVLAVLVACLGWVANTARADGPVRIYIANDDHTDYVWTADAETYNRAFVDMLDHYLDLADATDDDPPPFQSRFNADGSYWLWQYERQKTPADFQRLMRRIQSGHISAPLTALVSCYGGQPAEAVLRGMYYSGRLERRFGCRFPLAVAMENQTLPLGLASLWAGSGARYSWRGVCACASEVPSPSLKQRDHEIYWYAGLDDQRVLMKWHSLAGGNKSIGGYAEAFNPVAAIRFLSSDADFLKRYTDPSITGPYQARAAFGFGWDALARKTGPGQPGYPATEPFHVIAREHTRPDLQVIVSNEADFFEDFARAYGEHLPAERVTSGNEWDLYSASMVETSARVRRSVEQLRAAELMATYVGLEDPAFLADRVPARDLAFMDLGLYWEHDWTADGPVPRSTRAAWQNMLADQIESYVQSLHDDAARRLSRLIDREGPAHRFVVLNPLGWPRTDRVDLAHEGPELVHVRDLTSKAEVPHQFVTIAGRKHLRILAPDVPALGYKVFEVREGDGAGGAATSPVATVGPAGTDGALVVENDRLRLVVAADGAIASLIDRTNGNRELVARIGRSALNDMAPDDARGQPVRVVDAGPVSVTLLCESNAGLPHTTAITLVRGLDRIDIENRITSNFTDVRHWTFSFNLTGPDVHAEEVGAIVHDKLRSQGGDYADSNARHDYLSAQHFADITGDDGEAGVTISNQDLSFAKLGGSTPAHLDTSTPALHFLAGGQVDGPKLGIPTQGGETRFLQRFALLAHREYSPAASMRFALEHQNPLVSGRVEGGAGAPYPPTICSILEVSDPNVMVWALKPAEEGIDAGIILRAWNIGDEPTEPTIRLRLPGRTIDSTIETTHIETDLKPITTHENTFRTHLERQRMKTFRLRLAPK